MATQRRVIDIDEWPELVKILEKATADGQAATLRRRGKELAKVTPLTKPARSSAPRRKRERVFSMDDPLWKLAGIGSSAERTDSSKKHDLIAQAYLDHLNKR